MGANGVMYKTSIVFSLAEGPGVLFKALSCFALRNIDLTKIERCVFTAPRRDTPVPDVTDPQRPGRSRPMRTSPITVVDPSSGEAVGGQVLRFSYLFYVDLVASTADVNTQNALRHLQEMAPFLRVLGCYQIAQGRTTP